MILILLLFVFDYVVPLEGRFHSTRPETIVNNCFASFFYGIMQILSGYKFRRVLNFADIKFRVHGILKVGCHSENILIQNSAKSDQIKPN